MKKPKVLQHVACFSEDKDSFFLVGSWLKERDVLFHIFDVLFHNFEGGKAFSKSIYAFSHTIPSSGTPFSAIPHCPFFFEAEVISPSSCAFWPLLDHHLAFTVWVCVSGADPSVRSSLPCVLRAVLSSTVQTQVLHHGAELK